MVSAAAFPYKTKYDAEHQRSELRKIEANIRFQRDTIDVLKADWSLLTQPARLQRLAETYQSELQLVPVEPRQIAEIDDLPVRPLDIEDTSSQPLGGMADAGTDSVVTGGTVR